MISCVGFSFFFFFNDTATTEIYTLSLHDALPILPCYKLGIKFGRADIIKRFLAGRRPGFYFTVMREGMVGAGDAVELVGHEQQHISVIDITRLYAFDRDDVKSLRHAIQIKALPESWKGYFRHQLEKQTEQQ